MERERGYVTARRGTDLRPQREPILGAAGKYFQNHQVRHCDDGDRDAVDVVHLGASKNVFFQAWTKEVPAHALLTEASGKVGEEISDE